MGSIVSVKKVRIGEGVPKICVPLVGRTKAEILEHATNVKKTSADVVEWRVDFFENVDDMEQVEKVLEELNQIFECIPLLFTFRTLQEGGEKEISIDQYMRLNKVAVLSKNVDLIDVEVFLGDEVVKDLIDCAHEAGVKVIVSNHDFHKTPGKEEIMSRLCKMKELGADIPKIAVMPNCQRDVLELLAATNAIKQKELGCPVITMSMSGMGAISRLVGETFGSALTFGAVGKISAPGQIAVEDLRRTLDILHNSTGLE